LIPALVLGYALFFAGYKVCARLKRARTQIGWLAFGALLAIPGVLMPLYYLHLFDRWALFFTFRALPLAELAASGAGILAGTLASHAVRLQANRHVMTVGMLMILTLGLAAPYIKPILAPVDPSVYRNQWRDGVCLQSTASCGAASAATILRLYGIDSTEREIALECYTYVSGTENWYLARALRKRGLKVDFIFSEPPLQALPVPSIAGINMGQAGHFITILSETADRYAIGDPLNGRSEIPKTEVFGRIQFTGFFMRVTPYGESSNASRDMPN
ncbi:MAG: hypothetical protein IT364_15375, partial [Candidatus Hydrogenedentes bacterium]|nr:hypothetical protein [Candidatus Hydrogenedentota bacterium]